RISPVNQPDLNRQSLPRAPVRPACPNLPGQNRPVKLQSPYNQNSCINTRTGVGAKPGGQDRASHFRKGLKGQIYGEPYLMAEMNFRKPGKGNAIYECTLKNLIRGTTLKRVFRGGDERESADVEEVPCQSLYRQTDTFFFMNTKTFDQYELS